MDSGIVRTHGFEAGRSRRSTESHESYCLAVHVLSAYPGRVYECYSFELSSPPTPFVFGEKLYRFEWVRPEYEGNKQGSRYRILDVAAGTEVSTFGAGHAFGCAYVEGDAAWAFGVDKPAGSRVDAFLSKALKHWESAKAIDLPGWTLFNTSVCKGPDGYVMAVEKLIGRLRSNGVTVLLVSHDMDQVMRVADRAWVLRRGRTAAHRRVSETDGGELVGLITGAIAGDADA